MRLENQYDIDDHGSNHNDEILPVIDPYPSDVNRCRSTGNSRHNQRRERNRRAANRKSNDRQHDFVRISKSFRQHWNRHHLE